MFVFNFDNMHVGGGWVSAGVGGGGGAGVGGIGSEGEALLYK